MEAPEKIYLQRILCSNEVFDNWKSQKTISDDIEYIRADVLDDIITKSAVWFANRYQANGSYLCANDTEDYENEIKEYLKQKWL